MINKEPGRIPTSITAGVNTRSFLQYVSGDRFKEDIINALSFKGEDQEQLFELARRRRKEFFPRDEVEVRSVIEVSNICRQKCKFCGMNLFSKRERYVLGREELMEVVRNIYSRGRRVLLLQSGENGSRQYVDFVSSCVSEMKQRYSDLTVILCMGNLSYRQYKQLREAGADRYILKFETSNPALYEKIKPADSFQARIGRLNYLIELGYEVGSGNVVGIPGQTLQDIANDLFFVSQFRLTMVSCSVFINGEDSVYHAEPTGDPDLALNYMALMRIFFPWMLIPSTSSLEKVRKCGQYLGLTAGANAVTVHDGTPEELKGNFPIYSNKRFTPDEGHIRHIVSEADLHFPKTSMPEKACAREKCA